MYLFITGFVIGFLFSIMLKKKQIKPLINKVDPSSFEFVGALIINDVTGECVLTVRDEDFQEFCFRGNSTVWHHYPTGKRAGSLWNIPAAMVETHLNGIWKANIKWKKGFKDGNVIEGVVVK